MTNEDSERVVEFVAIYGTAYEVIKYAKQHDIEGLMLSLDFEKCFDKIEFEAIYGSLPSLVSQHT